jgi:hypothetical protein
MRLIIPYWAGGISCSQDTFISPKTDYINFPANIFSKQVFIGLDGEMTPNGNQRICYYSEPEIVGIKPLAQ